MNVLTISSYLKRLKLYRRVRIALRGTLEDRVATRLDRFIGVLCTHAGNPFLPGSTTAGHAGWTCGILHGSRLQCTHLPWIDLRRHGSTNPRRHSHWCAAHARANRNTGHTRPHSDPGWDGTYRHTHAACLPARPSRRVRPVFRFAAGRPGEAPYQPVGST